MDEITQKHLKATLNLHIQDIYNILHEKKEELMDLEYATDNCDTYFEDEVWNIFNELTAAIKEHMKIIDQVESCL